MFFLKVMVMCLIGWWMMRAYRTIMFCRGNQTAIIKIPLVLYKIVLTNLSHQSSYPWVIAWVFFVQKQKRKLLEVKLRLNKMRTWVNMPDHYLPVAIILYSILTISCLLYHRMLSFVIGTIVIYVLTLILEKSKMS